jgi:predicted ArsR family transcriptional regulator
MRDRPRGHVRIILDLTARSAPMNTKEMAEQFRVSERTARRHIARYHAGHPP